MLSFFLKSVENQKYSSPTKKVKRDITKNYPQAYLFLSLYYYIAVLARHKLTSNRRVDIKAEIAER